MRLIGVGMGPGDPELVTLKAVRLLREAGRVFVPVLETGEPGRAEATVRRFVAPERIERLVFALNEREDHTRRERYWDAAGQRVAQWLAAHQGMAAFATIGDPNVYSTFSYLAQTVRGLTPQVVVETVPGITAMQALAAAAGVPLVEGTEPLTLLPMARGVSNLENTDGTVVVYKGGRHMAQIVSTLRDAGRLEDAILGSHIGLAGERVRPLSEVQEASYLSTVLIPARRSARGGRL